MNNRSWTKREDDEVIAEWNKTKVAATPFAYQYASGVDRTASAVRLRIGHLIAEGKIEPHGAEFGPAQVLIIDIETLPLWCRTWGIHDQTLGIDNVIKDMCVLSVSATWLYSGKVESWCLTPKEAKTRDDIRIVREAWKLLEKAEVVIAHYGRRFDMPKLNSRFLFHGLKPPTPYKIIDTKSDIPTLGMTSKKQDYLSRFTGQKRKLDTDYQLWIDCDEGDPKALKRMEQYNRGDVMSLEAVYTILRPWISGHPNLSVFEDHPSDRCPACKGSLTVTNSRWPTTYYLYPTWRCKTCGAVGRGRFKS